ncbi:hypothetical protein [Curtobacterium sp. MCSS17_016]|uniref:hypothetical protein n=1 Tax=Curtobacterium sp. MCSS17_016 TaxID=2175644 RepID=UPI0015E8C1D0|nr:hypothetical protein [Curtobacterium sp. MCSS17_016]WIE81432.1 hypothetical protein DEJ19_019545 [Curtobacterium sp. MCSS17_016]
MTLLQLIVGTVSLLAGATLLLIGWRRHQGRPTVIDIVCIIAGFVILGTTPTR